MSKKPSNGDRIWKWKKVDVLFVVGLGVFVYGAIIRDVQVMSAGAGLLVVPFAYRGDRP